MRAFAQSGIRTVERNTNCSELFRKAFHVSEHTSLPDIQELMIFKTMIFVLRIVFDGVLFGRSEMQFKYDQIKT